MENKKITRLTYYTYVYVPNNLYLYGHQTDFVLYRFDNNTFMHRYVYQKICTIWNLYSIYREAYYLFYAIGGKIYHRPSEELTRETVIIPRSSYFEEDPPSLLLHVIIKSGKW